MRSASEGMGEGTQARVQLTMRLAATLLLCVVSNLIFTSGCERDAAVQAAPPVQANPQDLRVVFEFIRSRGPVGSPDGSGIRLAVWEDGSVLFGVDPENPENQMRVGQLSAAELELAWKAVRESGLTTRPDTSYLVPDADAIGVVMHVDGRKHSHWFSDYRWAGIDWWPKAEEALAKFRPAISQPVAEVATDGMYRGYYVKEWWRTSWRR